METVCDARAATTIPLLEGVVLLECCLPSANKRLYEQTWLPYRSEPADDGPGGCIRTGLDIVLIARSSCMLAASTVAFVPKSGFSGLKLFIYLVGSLVEIPSELASNTTRSLLMYLVLAQGAYRQCLQERRLTR